MTSGAEPTTIAPSGFRADIEGLRALAVIAVLLYHGRLGPFEGGYIGVDVFFVVSGFLITRLLLDEAARSGVISLPRFWARRARRILPASTLVIVATLLASRWILDPLTQGFANRSGLAAAGFVANIVFWTRGGYSHLALPEPLLHYWSLAVEEQFYLFWPVLVAITVRFRRARPMLIGATAVIGVASFVLCVGMTPNRQSFTFFWLPARAWELLVGAALAIAGPRLAGARTRWAAVAGWLGLAGIVAAAVMFVDPERGFPGARAALPVLGTALVIIGGSATGGPGRILGLAPLQWVGQRSYSIYLWHFPFLILAGAKWQLGAPARAGVLAASVLVAAISYALVENPIRHHRALVPHPGRSLAMGAYLAATAALVAGILLSVPQSLRGGEAAAAPVLVQSVPDSAPEVTGDRANPDGGTGTGAPAPSDNGDTSAPPASPSATSVPAPGGTPMDGLQPTTAAPEPASSTDPKPTVDQRNTGGPYPANPRGLRELAKANTGVMNAAAAVNAVPSNLDPSLTQAYSAKPRVYADHCILSDSQTRVGGCAYGDLTSTTVIVLFGDSHAAQWFPAFEAASKANGWKLVVMTKMACPAGDIVILRAGQTEACRVWRANVVALLKQLHPALLVMSSYRYKGSEPPDWKVGFDATVSTMRPLTDRLLILGDTPTPRGDVPSCVSAHLDSLQQCNRAKSEAVKPPWLAVDAAIAKKYDGESVTVGDWLCGATICPVVVGNVLMYRDETHLTAAGAALMTPYIEATVRWMLGA